MFFPVCLSKTSVEGNSTVVGDYINTMKTTILIKIKLLNSMDTQKHISQENLLIKKAFL